MNDFPQRPLSPAGTMRRRELLARAAQMGIACPRWVRSAPPAAVAAPARRRPPAARPGNGGAAQLPGLDGQAHGRRLREAYPGAGIKQASLGSISSGAIVPQIKANMSTYDAALGDQAVAGQGLPPTSSSSWTGRRSPTSRTLTQKFRSAYTHGIPTDYGKTGIGYRTDLVRSPSPAGPTCGTWLPSTRARSCSSTSTATASARPSSTRATRQHHRPGPAGPGTAGTDRHQAAPPGAEVIQHRPGLAQGSYAIAMDSDYDVALAQQDNPHDQVGAAYGGRHCVPGGILRGQRHAPDRGVGGVLQLLPRAETVRRLREHHRHRLRLHAATPYIKQAISKNPALIVDPATLAHVEFENYLGEATAAYNKLWDQFKSA